MSIQPFLFSNESSVWIEVRDGNDTARALFDRHYSRCRYADGRKPLLRGPWKFAYDYLPERSAALRVLHILRDEPSKRKRVYVLIGNKPFEACLQRSMEVIENGGEPYCPTIPPKDCTGSSRLRHSLRVDSRS